MKLLHLGDLHLGKSLGEFDLIEDQRYILDQILDIVREKRADAVLIAGDVYDKAVPSEAATNLLDYFLRELAGLKVKTFMISGNHDSDERLNYGSGLFETNQIYISALFHGALGKQTVTDEYGEVDIYLLPFVKASQVKRYYPEAKIESYQDAVRTIIENTPIDGNRRNVILAHQFVAGRERDPFLGGSEGASAQSVGLIEKINYDCFDPFDYVALGHIHSPQRVGRDGIRYAGSPLKYSLSEARNEKSVPLVTLKRKGEAETEAKAETETGVEIELIPLKPMRDLRHIKGTMEKLLSRENISNTEDFIYATLTDEAVVSDAMGIFQRIYPNTVKIDYDNSHTRAIEQVDISKIAEKKSFDELIGDFYSLMYGCGITDEEMAVMKEIAEEAGVIDEAG